MNLGFLDPIVLVGLDMKLSRGWKVQRYFEMADEGSMSIRTSCLMRLGIMTLYWLSSNISDGDVAMELDQSLLVRARVLLTQNLNHRPRRHIRVRQSDVRHPFPCFS